MSAKNVKKREQILAYVRKNKKMPPLRHPLNKFCRLYRYNDPAFKRQVNVLLRKAGTVLLYDSGKITRKKVIVYIQKFKCFPPEKHPLCDSCTNHRMRHPEFKRLTNSLIKKFSKNKKR